MKAVVNTTPLVSLAQIGQLDILRQLFTEILIPETVFEECTARGDERPGAKGIREAFWLQRHSLPQESDWSVQLLGLDPGERDVLRLAGSLQPDWVLIDEKLGRRVAKSMGFQVKGTIGVLLDAYNQNHLTKSEALQAIQRLEQSPVRISQQWLDWFRSQL